MARLAVLGSILLFTLTAPAQFRLTDNSAPQAPTAQNQPGKQINVPASNSWIDTGIVLNPGDKVAITGSGSLQFQESGMTGPDGLQRSWRDVMQALPLNSAGRGALIARIGKDPAVVPFLVGARKEFTVSRAGQLFLRVNLADNESLNGGYQANIAITPASKVAAKSQPLTLDPTLLEKIPRRVADSRGNAGDMVNFVLIGSRQQMLDAFSSAGWVQVDRTKEEAVAHAILSTIAKQSYVEMPMSELYLYGRPQDFGMARAEPIAVVQTRHHLRVWKAPFQINGKDVWVGAATHDLGFEKDERNGDVTHRIDPNVDDERNFVEQSLTDGGGIAASAYAAPKDPVRTANTATGGSFHSDGRILVMQLTKSIGESNTAEQQPTKKNAPQE